MRGTSPSPETIEGLSTGPRQSDGESAFEAKRRDIEGPSKGLRDWLDGWRSVNNLKMDYGKPI
jgi:hypothetical protein